MRKFSRLIHVIINNINPVILKGECWMTDQKKNIIKSLFNYHRIRILQVIKDKQKTVKEIAQLLNEKPSRLYYHINQLEKNGLIKVIDEKK